MITYHYFIMFYCVLINLLPKAEYKRCNYKCMIVSQSYILFNQYKMNYFGVPLNDEDAFAAEVVRKLDYAGTL